jgi:hypothetical protein
MRAAKRQESESRAGQADGAAAAVREAEDDDSGLRGVLFVTRGELLVALWLSLVCAVTAALIAVPASALFWLGRDLSATLGERVDRKYSLRDTARMQRREPYTVDFDWSTPTARWAVVLADSWHQSVLLLCFPVCYVAYLGASLKVSCVVLGSAVITFMVSMGGFVVSAKTAFRDYSTALGLALLVVALKLVCPRNSTIARHALKQTLACLAGNVLVMNVIPETTVSAFTCTALSAL